MKFLAAAFACAAVAAAVACAPASARPFSYLSMPTDQLGVPGYVSGTDLTPTGSLYTGWTELEFRFGPRLGTPNASSRELIDGRSPVVRYSVGAAGVSYTVTVVCGDVGHRPVNFIRVLARNRGRRPAVAAVGTDLRYSGVAPGANGQAPFRFRRPANPQPAGDYTQPGAAFDPAWRWAFEGSAVTRDGNVLFMFPSAPKGVTRSLVLNPAGTATPVTETTRFGAVTYRMTLSPGAGRELRFTMPVIPVAPDGPDHTAIAQRSFGVELSRVLGFWHTLFARAIGIDVPEPKVSDTFYTSLANMAMSRYRASGPAWVQTVNKLQYNAFWLRDAAFISDSFDLAGLSDLAGQDLEFFPSFQQADGLFNSQSQQYDGLGEALWALGHHAAFTHDRRFAAQMLDPLERAVGWLERERASDRLGLMPYSVRTDNELVTGHITGDDFMAADGLRESLAVAQLLGRGDLVQRWRADLSAFASDLSAQLSRSEAATGGWIPPALEANGGQDWGNLWAAYPEPFLPAGAPAVTATLRHAIAHFREGVSTYLNDSVIHGYLAFRVFETELLRGEQAAVVNGLYAELAHTTATNGGFELAAGRVILDDLAPHGWFAAEYVALLRNMLVREDGATVVVMGAVPPRWLLPGQRIAVTRAPTSRGRLTYTLRAASGGAVLTWRSSVVPGTHLVWPVPAAVGDVRARGLSRDGRTITLSGASGRLVVRWRLHGPFPSFAATARRVMAG